MVVVWVMTAMWRFPWCSHDPIVVVSAVVASRAISNVTEKWGDALHSVGAFRARRGERRRRRWWGLRRGLCRWWWPKGERMSQPSESWWLLENEKRRLPRVKKSFNFN